MKLRWRFAQFFEFRWWKKYLMGKTPVAYLDWKKRYWQQFLEHAEITMKPGAALLDAGCGPAGIFILLHNQSFEIDAVDPLIDQYDRHLPVFNKKDYPAVRFWNVPIEQFTAEKKYDFVFCLNAINHVADLSVSLDGLAGLTKSGGYLLLSVDAHNYTLLKRFFRYLPGDVLHPHQHSLREYIQMLQKRDFNLVRTILIKRARIFSYYLLVATREI